ncbi:MAG: reverse transcriptase family protein, partial [Oscillospiraceae bacterium]
ENCLLLVYNDYLGSAPHQFGFKKGRGCRDAIYVLSETVNYYVSNCSTVNICTIDVTKAFDRINHKMLFMKLIDRKTPLCFIDVLINWYGKCICQIKWNNLLSKSFFVTRGVRQGGILSPLLFSVYVDDALQKLVYSGLGCNFFGFLVGALMYADDLILMSASVFNLQKLIALSEILFDEINLKINISKCSVMRIGDRCNTDCVDIMIGNEKISWSHEIKYLGVYFQQSSYLKINVHSCKVKFFQAFNNIFAKIGSTSSIDTIVQLLKSNCLSVLLYNLEAVQLTKTNLNNLSFPINRAFIKIFHISDSKSIKWCQYYLILLPVESILDQRKRKFYFKLANSECPLLNLFYNKSACNRLIAINEKYNVLLSANSANFLKILWEKCLTDLSI